MKNGKNDKKNEKTNNVVRIISSMLYIIELFFIIEIVCFISHGIDYRVRILGTGIIDVRIDIIVLMILVILSNSLSFVYMLKSKNQ